MVPVYLAPMQRSTAFRPGEPMFVVSLSDRLALVPTPSQTQASFRKLHALSVTMTSVAVTQKAFYYLQ